MFNFASPCSKKVQMSIAAESRMSEVFFLNENPLFSKKHVTFSVTVT
jgi:hypothetical protein